MLEPSRVKQSYELTNVDNVTLAVDHNITVVSVLDLQNVACDRVCSHRLDKVETRSLELHGILATILGNEKVEKIVDLCPTHLVSGRRIRYDVDNTTLDIISTG